MKTAKSIKSLEALKLIFVFVLFMNHLDAFNQYYQTTPHPILQKIIFEGFLGLGFLFVLYGFMCSFSYKKQIQEEALRMETFIGAELKRVYPLILISIALGCILYGVRVEDILSTGLPFLVLLQSFVPVDGFAFNFNGVVWIFSNLLLYYVMFYWLVKYAKEKLLERIVALVLVLVIAVFISISYFSSKISNHSWFYFVNPFMHAIDFFVGMYVFELYQEHAGNISRKKATVLEIASLIVLIVLVLIGLKFEGTLLYRWNIYYLPAFAFMIYAFSPEKGWISGLLQSRVLQLLANHAISIYIVHQLMLHFVLKFFKDRIVNIYSVIFPAVLALVLSLLFSVVYEFLFTKLTGKE